MESEVDARHAGMSVESAATARSEVRATAKGILSPASMFGRARASRARRLP